MFKILILIFSLLSLFNKSLASSIYEKDYFSIANITSVSPECLNEANIAKSKIDKGTLILNDQQMWDYNFNSFICKINLGQINNIYEEIIYLNNYIEQNEINIKNDFYRYLIFVTVILPLTEEIFPEIYKKHSIPDSKIMEVVQDSKVIVEKEATEESIVAFNSMLAFISSHFSRVNKKKIALNISNNIIKNKSSKATHLSYVLSLAFTPIYVENKEKKISIYYDILNEISEFKKKYGFNITLTEIELVTLRSFVSKLSQEKKIEEIYKMINGYDFETIEKEIPKTHFQLINLYVKLNYYIAISLAGYVFDIEMNWEDQIFYTKKSMNYLIDKILLAESIYLSNDQVEKLIEEHYDLLEYFQHLTHDYVKFSNKINKEFDLDEYWEVNYLSIKSAQILNQNDVNKSINQLIKNHQIKNKDIKNKYNEKLNIEKNLLTLSKKINTSEIIVQNDLNEFLKIKTDLKNLDNEIRKTNPELVSNLSQLLDWNNLYFLIEEDELLYIINKTKKLTYVYIVGRTYFRRNTWGNDTDPAKKINDLYNYSRNINNYNSKNFPFNSSYEIYKYLFENPFAAYNDPEIFSKINHISIVANDIYTTFPYWLLLRKKYNNFKLSNLSNYNWFSKKFSYSVYTSLNEYKLKQEDKFLDFGVRVTEDLKIAVIEKNSLADEYKFEIDDKILKLNDKTVNSWWDMHEEFRKKNIKNKIKVTIKRNNQNLNIIINNYKKSLSDDLFEDIVAKFNNAKQYDFVGIGNPVLNPTIDNINTRGLFKTDNEQTIVNIENLKYFAELPETELELLNIQKNFNIDKTKLYLKEEAIEKNIKDANLTNAKYIVFATHALIAGEIDELKEPGIVLTPDYNDKTGNEGLLLASEISNLNLLNTDLVVLSACNTSSAINSSSIPLSGIAKSFFLAGVKSLIVTGWSVESDSAAYLSSNTFNKSLKNNLNFSTALQRTINEMINKNMHPLMWAPFIIIGDR